MIYIFKSKTTINIILAVYNIRLSLIKFELLVPKITSKFLSGLIGINHAADKRLPVVHERNCTHVTFSYDFVFLEHYEPLNNIIYLYFDGNTRVRLILTFLHSFLKTTIAQNLF